MHISLSLSIYIYIYRLCAYMCMYVCMYVYIYIYMYIYIYIYIYICKHIYIYMDNYNIYIYIYIYIYMHTPRRPGFVTYGRFSKLNLEKWARTLGDLNFQREFWSEHKQWIWDLRPSILNFANRSYENRP